MSETLYAGGGAGGTNTIVDNKRPTIDVGPHKKEKQMSNTDLNDAGATANTDYTTHDLTVEEWREYVQTDANGTVVSVHRIDNPQTLVTRAGGTTHRVTGLDGVTYAFPVNGNCPFVPRWKSKDPENPVAF